MPQRFSKVARFAVAVLACASANGSEYRETECFADAAERVEQYAREYGSAKTLLVVDIDNTLLAMRDPLGSDQWFEWQEYLLKQEPQSPHLVADTFPGLLKVQGVLFDLGQMRPPEPDLPNRVRDLQALGVPTLVLTSRGDAFRAATQRELVAAGYDFASTVLPTKGDARGPHPPYDADDWSASGLEPAEAELFELSPTPRPVSFENGVFMAAGQHKGAMLLTVLHRAVAKPKAVVYVDDHGRHVHRVSDALARRGIESTVFHYHREDDNVKRFRYGDKRGVAERWRRLKASLEAEPSTPAAAAR